MTDATLRIKNLSIALEALSRVSGYAATSLCSEVAEALMAEIKDHKEEKLKEKYPTQTYQPTNLSTTSDDDIPF